MVPRFLPWRSHSIRSFRRLHGSLRSLAFFGMRWSRVRELQCLFKFKTALYLASHESSSSSKSGLLHDSLPHLLYFKNSCIRDSRTIYPTSNSFVSSKLNWCLYSGDHGGGDGRPGGSLRGEVVIFFLGGSNLIFVPDRLYLDRSILPLTVNGMTRLACPS